MPQRSVQVCIPTYSAKSLFCRVTRTLPGMKWGWGLPAPGLQCSDSCPFASNCTQSHGVHGNFPKPKKPKGHRKDAQRDSGTGSSAVTHAVAASPAVSLSPGTSVLCSPKPAVASKVQGQDSCTSTTTFCSSARVNQSEVLLRKCHILSGFYLFACKPSVV